MIYILSKQEQSEVCKNVQESKIKLNTLNSTVLYINIITQKSANKTIKTIKYNKTKKKEQYN